VEPDEENAMDDAVENGGDQNALNKRCNNAIDSEFHTSDNQSVEKEGPAINENDERDGEANFVIFQPSDILPNQQKTHKRNTRASIIGMKGTIRRPGRRTTAVAERRKASRSKKVAVQGMLYVVAFYITWFFPTMSRITDLVAGKNYFAIQFFDTFLIPLQGFFNCAIYLRPRIQIYRRRKKDATFWTSLKAVIFERD